MMPGGDRTGPWGAGPRTGRAAGFCSGYGMPGFMNRGTGFGFGGRGGGWGRGQRRQWFATGLPGWARFGAGAPLRQDWAGAFGPGPQGMAANDATVPSVEAMRRQAEYMEKELGALREQIARLETEVSKDS